MLSKVCVIYQLVIASTWYVFLNAHRHAEITKFEVENCRHEKKEWTVSPPHSIDIVQSFNNSFVHCSLLYLALCLAIAALIAWQSGRWCAPPCDVSEIDYNTLSCGALLTCYQVLSIYLLYILVMPLLTYDIKLMWCVRNGKLHHDSAVSDGWWVDDALTYNL